MKNHNRWMRGILLAGAMALLLSCGGGGGSGSAVGSVGIGGSSAVGSGSDSSGSAGTGSSSTGTAGGADGSGSTGSGTSGSTGGGTDGTSTAGNSSGDGVGSGGTGVSTADATGVGSVGGLGSIILNGVRYKTYPEAPDGIDPANFSLEDTNDLQIGMSVRIAGKIDSQFTAATAQQVVSAAELRGAVSAINLAGRSFVVMGTTVTTDNATVWSGAKSLDKVPNGALMQVWGLPSEPGALRATRVELNPASSEPLVSGYVQNLDTLRKTFTLGQLTVKYRDALFSGGIDESGLANALVRTRGNVVPGTGVLNAYKVQGWYAIPTQNNVAVQLAGVITSYTSTSDFKVLGRAINASQAQIPPGQLASIGNGVKVEVDGFMSNGVLVAKKLRIRNIPGTGGPVSFTFIGPIGYYHSASNFIVKGQHVDASGLGADDFENGTVADLATGRRVTVVGDTVENGVLIANRVTFTQP